MNAAFGEVLKHMTNIPAAAAKALPLDKKWRIVQEFRATKKDEPDEFINSLKGQESSPDWKELEKIGVSKSIAGQSKEWMTKFCKRGGHNHLFLLLSKLMGNAKQSGTYTSPVFVALIQDLAKVKKENFCVCRCLLIFERHCIHSLPLMTD